MGFVYVVKVFDEMPHQGFKRCNTVVVKNPSILRGDFVRVGGLCIWGLCYDHAMLGDRVCVCLC